MNNIDYSIALEEACNQLKKKLNSDRSITSKETIIIKKSKTMYIVKNRKSE